MPQSLSAVFVHLVWSTKDRKPWLRDPTVRTRLHAYLGGVSREMQCPPVIVGGVDDHVHVLGQLGREVSIAGWVKELKRVSSIWMKDVDTEFKGFYWQGGYGAFSVSQSNLARVEKYIVDQETHHAKFSFQDELRTLFRKHGIEWDERYVWD